MSSDEYEWPLALQSEVVAGRRLAVLLITQSGFWSLTVAVGFGALVEAHPARVRTAAAQTPKNLFVFIRTSRSFSSYARGWNGSTVRPHMLGYWWSRGMGSSQLRVRTSTPSRSSVRVYL